VHALEATSLGISLFGFTRKALLFVFVVGGSAFLKFEGESEATPLPAATFSLCSMISRFDADHSCSRIVDSAK